MASRETQKLFFFLFSPLCIEMVKKMLGKKRKMGKCEKNMPTRHLKSHPAGGQETKLFLRVALEVRIQNIGVQLHLIFNKT